MQQPCEIYVWSHTVFKTFRGQIDPLGLPNDPTMFVAYSRANVA